jgi:hypothetical protein
MALPTGLTPARSSQGRATRTLTIALVLGSILCLALPSRPSTEPWIFGLSALLIIGATILIFVNVAALRQRTGQIALARGEPAFVIGPSRPNIVTKMVYGFAWLAAVTAQPRQPWSSPRLVLLLVFVFIIAASCLELLSGRPRIELRPQSLRILTLFYRYAVPWDAISSPTPRIPNDRTKMQTIRLNITQPDLVSSRGVAKRLPRKISLPPRLIYPRVDVATLIDHYLTHPEDRHAIGTPDQLQSLHHSGLA